MDEAGFFHKIPKIDDSRLAELFARDVLGVLVHKELLSPEWVDGLLVASIQEINEAFGKWLEDYNFCHEHEGIDRKCRADRYGE